ncbi:putative sushi, von Willebrand factor type A [Apostichopus japonicus]|uniref:Putative sushi, von Willebrand factor type A n=1 Tax=Stichopus japonicus TaxID=307972 RepID=A0A2G8LMU8_STIJA|nr:putative sushi, von Willebrand factor type A [Apostichopus japonicus]
MLVRDLVEDCASSEFDEDLAITPDQPCHANGASVTLACAGTIGGPPSNQCSGGSWAFPMATCDVWSCTPPVIGDAVTLTPDKMSYTTRETVTYGCDPGYNLIGSASASCDSQDSWNPVTVPICSATCSTPVIDNGALSSTGPFGDGDTTSVTCGSGYSLASGSSSTISCTNGAWSEIPECFLICNVPGVTNSDSASADTIPHGGTKDVECNPGYSFDQMTTFSLECTDGAITGVIPSQCYQDCTLLTSPTNGKVSGEDLHGETATYSCDRGYLLNDTETVTCNDGTWSDTNTPTCHRKSLENSIVLFCNTDKFIVEMPLLLLEENANVNSVLLGNCSGSTLDSEYLYANSSYNDCGTTMEVDNVNRKIIYRNELTSVDNGPVTSVEAIHLNIECVFDQENTISSSAVVQNSLDKNLAETGSYKLSFGIYTDDTFSTEISGSDVIETNDDLVVLAQVVDVANLDVYPVKCYATPDEVPAATTYDLIINGCSVSTYATGLSTSEAGVENPHLAFDSKAFRFTASGSDTIYFHCDLRICPLGDCPLSTNCGGSRRRRDIAGSNLVVSKHVSAGPIKLHHSASVGTDSSVHGS